MSTRLFRYLRGVLATVLTLASMAGTTPAWAAAEDADGGDEFFPASPQAPGRGESGLRKVFRDRVVPHWFAGDARFWYRNELRDGESEFVVVDAERGARSLAFDHARLAEALSRAVGKEFVAGRLPFERIQFLDEGRSVGFRVGDTAWKCTLDGYVCTKLESLPPDDSVESGEPTEGRRGRRGASSGEGDDRPSNRSPDGQWSWVLKDHNVFVRSTSDETKEFALSTDGSEGRSYGVASWAPDSKSLVAFRIESGERKEVYLVESSPKDGGRAKLRARGYPLPGDRFARYEVNIFDVASRKQMKPAVDVFEHEWLRPRVRWSRDGRRVAWQQVDRGHQRFRVIEVDVASGAVRNLVDERTETFIWTAHTENLALNAVNWLTNSEDILYVSEKSGWRHLYRVEARSAAMTPVTSGEWVLRAIDRIDEEKQQVWFRAGGVRPGQDPYLLHYGRVNFDGTGLVWLTEGDGNHTVQYSPDRRFLIDTYSRVDLPPVNELRRVSDGALLCRLEEADIRLLREGGWRPPEVFVAKGRDGKTDIWGIVCRPTDFDPAKKYPVIEDIYAGPQSSYTPKTFSASLRYESLTKLGFVVVKLDGMGTANRSKAFHDVCWKNLHDGGFPDRILWMKAAAAKHPELDLTRVGVYGTSAGGQNAAGAVLFHPEFYKAAVANCGCHDNRMDKASWNEQWMGYPVGPHYAEASNIDNAHRLQGHLMLVVGELDDNVPPESTYRFADALIRANKDFEFLLVPGGGHGAGGAYGQRRLQDFFVRHLLGQEPPNRNAGTTQPK